ncbi:DNA-directed RNA polymerase subunit beta' [Spirochaetota bacterium]
MQDNVSYEKIRIGLASPEMIRDWSYGEVLKPETINYRTLRPEKDGLFCERIFGTTKEWECYCGKFKSIRYKGVICDRCGVEVTHFKVRRERMGHIELAAPVAHIWFYKTVPSRIGLILDISVVALKSVIYYEKYIVIDPGNVPELSKLDLLTEEEYFDHREKYGENYKAGIGAGVIKDLLQEIDLPGEAEKLREEMRTKKNIDKRKLKRLSIIDDLLRSNNKQEWMILDVIPVIPPELRPMVQLEGGRFATSDLNDLYRRLINRNNRLKKLLALKAPEIIVKNEKRMLQEAVDALFDNTRRKRAVKGAGNRPLKSLSDILKGKQGRFRQNLLGKRVDYSGRSVIVVGPELKLHQCGLPQKMALELFKPFIMKKLVDKKLVFNIKSARRLIENEYPEVWRILEEVVKEHPVMLNRAPTLHRLGIQAFEPLLTSDKAIRLHPLVCTAYNADFDGDQMAVHVPLTSEAQIECWLLMLSSKNLLDPANGNPIVNPTQDMILGSYYLTSNKKGSKGEGKHFSSPKEVLHAVENKTVEYQTNVKVKVGSKWIETTPGRILYNQILPDELGFINYVLDSKRLEEIIAKTYRIVGPSDTASMLDDIKDIGFHFSTIFGATISLEDIIIPEEKKQYIDQAHKEIEKVLQQHRNGAINNDERYQRVISMWTSINEELTQVMMNNLRADKDGFNPLYIMSVSGARGSRQQIRQLAGMRGLMAKPNGEIIEMPIISNFKEGLSVLEYFISTHGARKGLSDTALKTADAGYLTRRLVDIAQDVVITKEDCGTINGVDIHPIKTGDEVIEKLAERVLGRYTAEPIRDPSNNEIILETNEYITDEISNKIDKLNLEKVKIRTVITCDSAFGICKKCYGKNLATGQIVNIGEAVGIIAAQSIGQPGTQLTMRTFHIGGAASSEVKDPEFKLGHDTVIRELPPNLVAGKDGKKVIPRKGTMTVARIYQAYIVKEIKKVLVDDGQRVISNETIAIDKSGNDIKADQISYVCFDKKKKHMLLRAVEYVLDLEVGGVFEKEINEFVKENEVIYRFDPHNEPIIAEKEGIVKYQDIHTGRTMKEEIDELTGIVNKKIMETKEEHLEPKIIIVPKEGEPFMTDLPEGAILSVEDNHTVPAGTVLARKIRAAQRTKDITGGLPRVQELFEARKPRETAVISMIDGIIEIGSITKGKRMVFIKSEFGDKVEHVVPAGKALFVRNGDRVRAGEGLSEGQVNPHDILSVSGEIALYSYVLNEVQEVYKLQGVSINDKHIGIIVRQMLRKIRIVDPGDTKYIKDQMVDKYILRDENKKVLFDGGQPAIAQPILLGLTKASLNTESFISSASFQETTKVLTNAAISNAVDNLRGLKENVIIGHKIPAGTGMKFYNNIEIYKDYIGDLEVIAVEEEESVGAAVEVKTENGTV